LISRRISPIFSAVLLLGLCLYSPAQRLTVPPSPERWATDTAGFLSGRTIEDLDATLESFERTTGHQVLVYIGITTAGIPIEDWAVKAFEAWKVGRGGLDDGLVLFIMAEDRKIRVEVGYGLEDKVPDVVAGRVIRDVLVPGFQSGNRDEAVREAVRRLLGAISNPRETGAGEKDGPAKNPELSRGEKILIGLVVLFFLIMLVTNPSLAIWLLYSIFSGGRGGGGGGDFGGRGGFRGGGGRSGGGGASGSW